MDFQGSTKSASTMIMLFLLAAQMSVASASGNEGSGTSGLPRFYYSRPDLQAPSLSVDFGVSGDAQAGNIFISPYFEARDRPDSGAYIFDSDGHLVWSGVDATGGSGDSDLHGLHLCMYKGEDHLCAWTGQQKGMHGSGLGLVLNKHYEVVKAVQSCSATASADMHEFALTADNTAIITVYQPQYHQGCWILDSIFQEVDLDTNECLFQWRSLNHIDLDETYVPQGSYNLAGSGKNQANAWDYCHINSVQKLSNGDFLLSLRHTDTITRISGSDGHVLWRLNGKRTDFHMGDLNFRRQHMARVVAEHDNSTILSLFNNDSDGFTGKGQPGTGMLIQVDHSANSVAEVIKFAVPETLEKQSTGMGSHQILDNGNHFISYGKDSAMTEHSANGSLVWAAHIGWHSWNYRATKASWVGVPKSPPALWTYAKSPSAPTAFHASWNGATEISHWQFYGSLRQDGPFSRIGFAEKASFETSWLSDRNWPFGFAEAFNQNQSLGRSATVFSYIAQPGVDNADACGSLHCFPELPVTLAAQKGGRQGLANRWTIHLLSWMEHFIAAIGLVACTAFFRQKLAQRSHQFQYQKLTCDSQGLAI